MIVALDAQLRLGTATGIGEYVRGLAEGLRSIGADARELCEPKLDPWRFDRRVLWDQVLLPRRARASGADVLHCASGTMPISLPLPAVVTVHDVAWLKVQEHARAYARWYFGAFSVARYRRARRIVLDSRFSRGELLAAVRGFDESIVDVVHPGVSADFIANQRESGDGRTVLVVGTVERRKNLEILVRALPGVPQARLVSVGPRTAYADECEALARRLGVADRVELRGYVPRGELLRLYATCAVAAVPSRYEGFGYGAAQALCAGAPLVCANTSSLPEVVGDDAPLLDPDDASAWTDALRRALAGSFDPRALAARGGAGQRFAWKTAAEQMLAVYESALVNG